MLWTRCCGAALCRFAAAVFVLLLLAAPSGARAPSPLALGFSDGAFTGTDGAIWLQRAAVAGADLVRIDIGWDAPNTATRPAGFDARNPADPHYNFAAADTAIRRARQLGLRVLVTFTGAPQWAEGPKRPPGASPGSWRPDPRALEDYGVALGRRYSGHFPDPADPSRMLPRVEAFQVWNEPNLSSYLTPQWAGAHAAAPDIYRAMLNAFYRGLKSVDPGGLVVTAGTAPFGDPQVGGERLQPARFWRGVLCLRESADGAFAGTHCSDPAHFDVLAHHTYSWGTPLTHALWPDDVAIPDIGKLTRLLRAAERIGTARPRAHHRVWVTEVGYNSKPPNPEGVPVAEHARWLEQALAELWREGVSAAVWFQVGDQPPVPDYASTSQSGVYYLNGAPKPAFSAYRFPLVAWRIGPSELQVWGRAPAGGRIVVEREYGRGWKTVRVLNQGARSTFSFIMSGAPGSLSLRAQSQDHATLVWQAS